MVVSDACKLTIIWAAATPKKHHHRSDSVASVDSPVTVDNLMKVTRVAANLWRYV